ncbi:hypothetical protein [Pseudobutyrivibrio sp.]|jgi:hypothetical protein|uniref:hypothetical protein n=1 Tax=Pseudobutyrivibrio sp. TaxID=2014367 RepID=UPI0025D196B3|nr:hypothetical protein [Pseudobutyrivibrio sp.]
MNTPPISPFVKLTEGDKTPSFNYLYKGYFMELLSKTIRMFEFKGLPETVNDRYLKTSLILTGNVALWKPKSVINNKLATSGEWYAVKGTLGAEPTAYYIPSQYVISNPILGSENIAVTDERITVFYWNSLDEVFSAQPDCGGGLYFLIDRTARILAEIYRSTITALKNSRVVNIFSAATNNEKETLNQLLSKMRNCEDVFTALQDFKSKVDVNPVLQEVSIKDILQEFVELEQFYLAQFYHAIGVNSNYNLKRAQINNEEIMTNAYILIVSLADVLPTLQRCCDEFNSKTGLSISVDYSEEWKKMQEMQNETPEDDKDSPNSDSDEDSTEEGSEEDGDTEKTT